MIKFKLPILDQQKIDDKIISVESEFECELDMTMNSELKWESQFPAQADKESLYDFADRIKNLDNGASVVSKLKVIYCWINSDRLTNFPDFLKMFNYTNIDFFEKLVKSISNIFEIVLNSSASKN